MKESDEKIFYVNLEMPTSDGQYRSVVQEVRIKPTHGHFRPEQLTREYAQAVLNRVYVTKQELEATHNPPDANVPATQFSPLVRWIKRYSLTHPSDDHLNSTVRTDPAKSNSEPPRIAMYPLFFLPRAQREVVWGDIAEMYSIRQKELGTFHSYLWLYKEVCLSMWSLVKQALVDLRKRTYRFYT
jgi:hypothetical protein